MKGPDHIAAVVTELREAGARDIVVIQGAKHPRVQWTGRNGQRRFYTLSGTLSDRRGLANARADVRRLLRDDGMLRDEPPHVLHASQRLWSGCGDGCANLRRSCGPIETGRLGEVRGKSRSGRGRR